MYLTPAILHLFLQLSGLLEQIPDEGYSTPVEALSGATIGQHVRHILECFQELEDGYPDGDVNYDLRKRDYRLETNRLFALRQTTLMGSSPVRSDKPLTLRAALGQGQEICLSSTYYRELLHNLDHAVHHMAMIRVGVASFPSISLPESFGVAYATLQFRAKSHSSN